MPLIPGAEPLLLDGAPALAGAGFGADTGVLLCHGFTGSPQSLRPWAEYLAGRGHTVSLPLLPGHGTRWQDLEVTSWQDWYASVDRELRVLRERCAHVVVCGLSMGGALALRLAARHGEGVAGLVLVNPAVTFPAAQGRVLPALKHVVRTVPGLTGDIALPGAVEVGYDRVPTRAAQSLRDLFRVVRAELPHVTQPLLLMHSRTDHVVPPSDSALVLREVSSADVTETVLERSYHVATLDHDAARVLADSHAFVARLTGAATTDGTVKEPAPDGT